jgi:hypothetical protein
LIWLWNQVDAINNATAVPNEQNGENLTKMLAGGRAAHPDL